jgi:hypothetical protein
MNDEEMIRDLIGNRSNGIVEKTNQTPASHCHHCPISHSNISLWHPAPFVID